MARIGPGTGLGGRNTTEEERNASGLDNDDTGSDGSSADDENNSSGGSNNGGTTGAASGHIRAGLHGEAGSQEIASDKHSAAGTSVDAVLTGSDSPDIVATDSQSFNKTVTAVASEEVTGGDGGTGASINTQTGEVDAGRPGDTSRLQEEVIRNTTTTTTDDSDDPSPTSNDSGGDGGGGDGAANQNPLLPTVPGAGGPGASIGGGGPLNFGDSGSLMDTLTSPAGIIMVVIATAALVFGGSEALEDEEDN